MRIAVVGNGAAGALVVIALVREATRAGAAIDVAWIGDGSPGRGVAYSTPHPWHRLNVPAAAMTLDEAETSFPDWLAARGLDDDAFAPRHAFGDYLVETLERARATAGATVRLAEHRDRAVHCSSAADGLRIALGAGTVVEADTAVLALGPFPAAPLPGLDPSGEDRARVVADPWDGAVEHIEDGGTVVLAGTGLTMVDVALTVARRAPRTHIVAVSRTGLVPREHLRGEGPVVEPVVRPRAGLGLDELVGGVERGVEEHDGRWREVVDGLRPVTPGLWRSLPRDQQRRFLDEQARRWEVHRHRMAPAVADELGTLVDDGRLRVHDGGLHDVRADGSRLRVHLGAKDEYFDADRVVACTGAQDDVTGVDDPLVRSLVDGGLARPHPLGLGFDSGPHGRLHDDGPGLYGIGILRRGELYETTSVPEIREQAGDLARHLLDREQSTPAANPGGSVS